MLWMAWRPSVADFADALERQNPWRDIGHVPEELAPPAERSAAWLLTEQLLGADPRRFQLVLGPRRVGKTTAMYHVVRHLLSAGIPPERVWWLRLDHPLLIGLPLGTLVESVVAVTRADSSMPAFLLMDELTYAEGWDLWLKTFYDERWPLRIAATSSSTAALRGRRMESGVGRWEEQHLPPWSFAEYLRLIGVEPPSAAADLDESVATLVEQPGPATRLDQHFRRYLLVGGFPELLSHTAQDEASDLLRSQRVLRADAVERAIYKDIPQVFGVNEPMKLERLLYVLAGQFTGLLSPASLAADLGLTQPTVDKYINYLEQSFLVFALSNYSTSEETVQRRGRKLFFWDGAVRNAALQRGIRPLGDDAEMGHLRENAVAAHLRALSEQTGVRLYHWRQGRFEVDLVYDHPERPFAFEIASSHKHPRNGLTAFQERHPRFRNRCYLVAPNILPMAASAASDGVGHLPLERLLVVIGQVAEAAQAARLGSGARR
jgi:predicted AAA+ superfamily ATPase